jgi:glycosyltransferase involved in cell wall biosynthesis
MGHEISVITGDTSYLSGRKRGRSSNTGFPNITVHVVKTLAPIHAGFILRLMNFFSFMFNAFWAAIFIKKPDVVYGTSPPIFQGLSAYLASWFKRALFVFEVRDLWPDFMIQIGAINNPIIVKLSRRLERFLYRKADMIIVNSPGFFPHVIAAGVSENKLRLVPNGVDTSLFKPQDDGQALRERLGFVGKFIVLYAGAIGKSNDIGVVLDAACLMKERDDIVILLVGGGNEKAELEARAFSEGLRNVIFIPPVEKAQIPDYIAAADVCLAILKDVPMFRTTYPNKVFDYMAGGRPVLLAIDGVIREVVEASGAGLFVQPGNPGALAAGIIKLYEAEGMRKEMGMRGREYVEAHFERREQAAKLERMLTDIVAKYSKS